MTKEDMIRTTMEFYDRFNRELDLLRAVAPSDDPILKGQIDSLESVMEDLETYARKLLEDV